LGRSERKKYLHIVGLVCSYFIHRGNNSPKKTVQTGYDKVVYRYARLSAGSEKRERQKSVTALIRGMPKGLDLLDLGCGTGLPSTKVLAGHFNVTGIDFSSKAIALAKQNIPGARFMREDITEIDFPPASFDVITAFYSIFHIPRRQQPGVIEKMEALLRPGGIILATMGIRSIKVLFEHDWMGTQMYWSSFDSKKNLECFKKAGLHILSAREVQEKAFGKSNTFLWVIAQKPTSADSGKEAIASEVVRMLED
jgi:ubiquinone/menaquinone biosynthesis C-methylase UbiE